MTGGKTKYRSKGGTIKRKKKTGGRANLLILNFICKRVKAEAKRKFDVYPSAYANMHGLQFTLAKKTWWKKKSKKLE